MAKKKAATSPGKSGIWHNVKRTKMTKVGKPKKSPMNSLGKQFVKAKTKNMCRVKTEKPLSEVRVLLSNMSTVKNEIQDEKELESQGLSQYERIRLRNIREREELFAKLQIEQAKDLVNGHRRTQDPKAPKEKPKKIKEAPKENIPPRKSLRISNGALESNERSYASAVDLFGLPIIKQPIREEGLAPVEKSRFEVLQVTKNCTIKEFVVENRLAFKCGRGFYEFTKPEIISYKKEVVIIEKSTGDMFTGQEACDMIGAGTGMRTPPTTFEKWRVFVQSTSAGRKLVAGTGFLYETD